MLRHGVTHLVSAGTPQGTRVERIREAGRGEFIKVCFGEQGVEWAG